MLMLLRIDHFTRGSGGFGRNQSRLDCGPHDAVRGVGAAVAERLVEAADRVVAVGDIEHVVRRPAVVEAVRPDAGHAALRHLLDLVIGERLPLVDDDRIEPRVVRTGAGRGVEERHRLVQVVKHRRMIVEKRRHLVARQRQRHAQAVAVVVVRDVLAPVDQTGSAFAFVRLAIVVKIDHRSRPSTSSAGVISTITFLRIAWMNGESSTARRYASSISISGEPVSGEWIEPEAQ